MDAVDDLSDAIDVTRNLLVPVRPWLWLKLAIVVFFLGSMTLGGGFQGDPSMFAQDPTIDDPALEEEPALEEGVEEIPDEVIQNLLLGLVVIGIAVLVLWLLFRFIGAIMEFVFIESLRTNEVHVRRYFKANVGRGIRLFVFRLLVFLVAAALVAVPALFIVVGTESLESMMGGFLLLMLFGLVLALVQAIVMRFTSEFVAPIMLLEERGVLGGWKRFWGTARANLSEYVVYLLLVWILQLVINIAAGIIMIFGIIIVAIPFVVVGVLLVVGLGDIGFWLAIPVGALGLLALLLVVALIEMPIRTYFQYYALLLLGDTNDEFDLIPDQREAVRDGGPQDDRDDRAGPADRDRQPDDGWDGDDRDDSLDDRSSDDGPVWDDETDSWDDDDWGSSSREDESTGDDWDGSDGGNGRDDSDDDRGW